MYALTKRKIYSRTYADNMLHPNRSRCTLLNVFRFTSPVDAVVNPGNLN